MKRIFSVAWSRRAVLRGSVALVAAAGSAATAAEDGAATMKFAQAAQKVAQKDVQYQETPKDGNKCSLCTNFQPPNACAIVAGTISPNGWCVAFAPKAS